EIKVPASLNAYLYEFMRSDLKRLLPQYDARIETRVATCLALVRTSKKDKIKARADKSEYVTSAVGYIIRKGNLARFVSDLNLFYMQQSPYPILDETGYSGEVDMELVANLSDVESLNKGLERYDLKISEVDREIDML